ncbi:haloacid dehalogenase superfamily protein, subfamily IA, variant 3 with third motif having DD or ED [Xenococcus sp. PCC 7305]|uniref:HAD family hydrolase n=1 Tax=Xenococcus sp. PCC 7305 TaxID=102125 RepID=UPI0002ACB821|nr:HAD family hydrolase [Xenococcus sp. PCC 7305]ELS01650.1 haloacid dehalogenase superfamily protein, subfamily IA, variant 3 with third motif having DD or ED [Xenococcus sp. PCC 7305]
MSNQLQALIFDVDGTLAETERDGHRVAFNRAFAEIGVDWHWSVDLYGELLAIAGGKERLKFYLEKYQPDWQTEDIAEFIIQTHQLKNQYYRSLLKQGSIPLRPGVKRLILEARDQKIRLAIATTSTLSNATALLETTLDPAWFEVIAAGDIVAHKKPAPDIYLYVLEQMNIEPEYCLVFEDTAHGLQAATQANLKTIVTVNEYTKNQDFKDAILVINHLEDPEYPLNISYLQQLKPET